uniref:Uncharacterized protein n=1 Tax=Tanacetum cinerariifolium TaxID=118510 RepID=A0A6L2JMW9_TANCI|nr:hypothetical protein [Tanacetum cinerariifolium]
MALDEQAQSSDDEDIGRAHIPTVNLSVDDPILRHNVSKPLPLGGPPGQVTIQSDFFFNKDLEYLRYGSKGSRPALSISKMNAAYYPDAGLEQMVPDQQRFYIDRHTSKGDRDAVRTHMRILSVVRIEFFSMYAYDYMKKIVLHRADLNGPVIAERDFKAVMFLDKYGVQMMMRFNEIHKFSDGTLQQIDEALDYTVKEYRINRMNPGLNTRFLTRKDVDRSKAFMFAIQKRLKTRRIFHNLESFVAVCSSLRSLKLKRTIESRAKRSSKIISLGYYFIMLAFSHTMKMKMEILLEPTSNKLLVANELMDAFGKPFEWVFDSLVHSFHALSALRCSSLRMASTTAKPCQGDSLEFYLITGSIYTDQQETVVLATLFNGSEQRHFCSFITNINFQESRRLQLLAKEMSIHNSMLTLQNRYR